MSMNFLVFDDELCGKLLVEQILRENDRTILATKSSSVESSFPSSDGKLSVRKVEINDASQVLPCFSRHQSNPIDAILLFDLKMHLGLTNVIKSAQRIEDDRPTLFLLFHLEQYRSDTKIEKILDDSKSSLRWTIVVFNRIEFAEKNNLKIDEKIDRENSRPVSSIALTNFLHAEIENKQNIHKLVFLSS